MSADVRTTAKALVAAVKQRIESRYRRIRFVHEELVKLGAAVPDGGTRPKGSEKACTFEDFVFSQIDFSIYKKIEAEEFHLLFDEGLADFTGDFFQKAFKMDREETRQTITRSYVRVGPFFVCKGTGPLLLSVMRSLHTSLEFAPLLSAADLGFPEGRAVEQLQAAAGALNGLSITHDDGMKTTLFIPSARAETPLTAGEAGKALLLGTFHPLGKAYTITLIP